MRLIPGVCMWFCLTIFRKKRSSRRTHDFILNSITFYNLFFDALELYPNAVENEKSFGKTQ